MGKLKNATLLEGLFSGDYEIRQYSGAALAERFDTSVPLTAVKSWKDGGELPGAFRSDRGCKEAWCSIGSLLSVPAIMDFYWNGPHELIVNARRQMVLLQRGYIYYIMNHFFTSFVKGYSGDLYSCGMIGLLRAMDTYNGQKAFTTYSKYYIIHEMAAFTYFLQGNPSCYYARIQKQIKDIVKSNPDAELSPYEISEMTGIKPEIVARELEVLRATEFVYLDEYPIIRDSIENDCESIEDIVENKVIIEILKKAVLHLNEEERGLLIMYFWKDYSINRIAREKGLSYSRVKKQYNEILCKLRNFFE